MISGRIEVNQFAHIRLILQVNFDDNPIGVVLEFWLLILGANF